ncbi:tropomyosin alpha-1 chain-like [Anopheles maculipalpis]|uniref:tropomyosin alpha-1 chain-like n=1 Tax=Anopheles maculipalpis TaxID=1496333 RepID=UPI002158DE16|nr:tropomyosin alpha-1 chain-like [Anopheles maculipalpis]
MADDQQEDPTSPPMTLEKSATSNDMVEIVRELLYKNKNTALVKAVELLVLNIQQRQVIIMLNQTLQEAIVQTDQMLKDLHDQPVMESMLNNIKSQNQSTRKQLGDKVESIRMHMKSNEVLRKQLKKEIMCFRSGIEDIKRNMHDKEETGKMLFQTITDTKARAEVLHEKFRIITGEKAKLLEETQERLNQLRNQKSICEDNVRQMKLELAECEKEMAQDLVEYEAVKQQVTEMIQAYHQVASEKAAIQQCTVNMVEQMQNEMQKLEQNFEEKKMQLDLAFVENSDKYKQKIEALDQTIGDGTNKYAEQAKHAANYEVEVCKMEDELNDFNNENVKLENELIKLKTLVQVNGELSKIKPTNLFGARIITRARPCKSVAEYASLTSDNEFDESCHLDNEQSFTSTEPKIGKL